VRYRVTPCQFVDFVEQERMKRRPQTAGSSSSSQQRPTPHSPSHTSIFSGGFEVFMVVSVLIILLALLLAPYLPEKQSRAGTPSSSPSISSSLESSSWWLLSGRSVEVINADRRTSILDYLPEASRKASNVSLLPVVFRHTSINEWAALYRWTPATFARGRLLPSTYVLRSVYIHHLPVFGPYWDESRPLSRVSTIRRANPHREVNLTVTEFFHRITHPQPNTYLYYSGSIETISELLEDLQPFDVMLELDNAMRQRYPNLQRGQNINVWFGQEGVVAAVHYDAYDNLYAQIYGQKRWYLIPPSHARAMYLYPFLHPSHAQSQLIDLRRVNSSHFRFFAESRPPLYVVTLQPGDVLFLPACWFHFVEAVNTSISVNVWTRTPQSALMTTVSQQLPFRAQDTRFEKLHAAVHYVVLLLRELNFHSPRSEVRDLYSERYEPLVRDGQLSISQSLLPTACPTFSLSNVPAKVTALAKQHASQLRTLPPDTFRLWLHNHIELVLYYALEVSDAHVVPAFMFHCFESVP
jgi:hypothetical protein